MELGKHNVYVLSKNDSSSFIRVVYGFDFVGCDGISLDGVIVDAVETV